MRCAPITILSTVIFVVSTSGAPAAEKIGDLTSDLDRLQLTLDGADHYYSLAPQQGKVILVRQCVPTEADCDHDVVIIWDEQGRRIFESTPLHDIPNMSGGHILGSALTSPDRLVVSTIVKTETFSSALAEYDIASGKLIRLIPTGTTQCRDLSGDLDGTIWCLGVDVVKRAEDQDYDLVYRFDPSGKLLGSSLPRSAFPNDISLIPVFTTMNGPGGFLPGDGEVRLWLPAAGELVTFDSDGEVQDRLVLPIIEDQDRAWLVSAPDGEVYALLIAETNRDDPPDRTQSLCRLVVNDRSWSPLQDPQIELPMSFRLAGADPSGLILLDRKSLELLWYPYEAFRDNASGQP